jgi:hypothetical protein
VEQPFVTEQLDGLLALFFISRLDEINQLRRYWPMERVGADWINVKCLEEVFDSHKDASALGGRPGRLRGLPSFFIPHGASPVLMMWLRGLATLFFIHVASISRSLTFSCNERMACCISFFSARVMNMMCPYLNHSQTPWMIPIGNIRAPAMRNPHRPSLKQVKM